MKIVYLSVVGNTRKFVNKFDYDSFELKPNSPIVDINEPFIMILPTYEPEVVDIAYDFMYAGNNTNFCKGVCGGGNRNFGEKLYGYTARDFSKYFDVPLLMLFEFTGSINDVNKLKEIVQKIERA